MKIPTFRTERPADEFPVCDGFYRAELFDEIVGSSPAQHRFLLRVYDAMLGPTETIMCIVSEPTSDPDDARLGSHVLTIFRGDRKVASVPDDAWANRERFLAKALADVERMLPDMSVAEDP